MQRATVIIVSWKLNRSQSFLHMNIISWDTKFGIKVSLLSRALIVYCFSSQFFEITILNYNTHIKNFKQNWMLKLMLMIMVLPARHGFNMYTYYHCHNWKKKMLGLVWFNYWERNLRKPDTRIQKNEAFAKAMHYGRSQYICLIGLGTKVNVSLGWTLLNYIFVTSINNLNIYVICITQLLLVK